MFTWNIQFVSRKRLADTLTQLMISGDGERNILVRIHTAIHTAEEATDLASFIKGILPSAQILGTSTSAIICEGKLIHDQCLISVTQMDGGNVRSVRIPLREEGYILPAEKLCALAAERVIRKDTRLLFAFAPESCREIERFVQISNEEMPGVTMIGGVTDYSDIIGNAGFVFDENGWSGEEMIFAALGGESMECCAGFATGVQVVGELHEITEAQGRCILRIDGEPATAFICGGLSETTAANPQIGFYFPLAYSFGGTDVPFVYGCHGADGLNTNHNITVGRKIRRGFFYDRKIISDNRSMYSRIESFEKGETLFAYSCRDRFRIYPNSVNWELSAYQNSNCSGCLTRGEIGTAEGRNAFTNCAFTAAAAGENPETQQMNPYVFSHTEPLEEDNRKLIGFLAEAARSETRDAGVKERMKGFVDSCRQMLLYSEKGGVANEAALHMDIQLGGYDRVCMIDVPEQRTIRAVFTEQEIEKTQAYYLSECASFAAQKNYRIYLMRQWQMAIAVPSYMVSLEDFTEDMKQLQNRLFQPKEGYIPIVSVFCVIDDCQAENLRSIYNAARLEMIRKNLLFHSCNGKEEDLDEERILEKYHMVHVINDALMNDTVIPYYQGIYDNETKTIHHYEALMRLKDGKGKVYSPYEFLDVARSYGLLYDKLNREMLRKVFDKFRDIEDRSVSVNLGMRDIRNEELIRYIYSFLSTAPHPENFIFEILENEDVDDYEMMLRFVDNIHKLGGKISIDDFGSGYSNLLHVISIPNDYLKIDGSIVRECNVNPASESLVKMISGWYRASGRNAKLIAEYVENEAIQKKLLEYGIDYSQGYLFSRPDPEVPEDGEDPGAGD